MARRCQFEHHSICIIFGFVALDEITLEECKHGSEKRHMKFKRETLKEKLASHILDKIMQSSFLPA